MRSGSLTFQRAAEVFTLIGRSRDLALCVALGHVYLPKPLVDAGQRSATADELRGHMLLGYQFTCVRCGKDLSRS